MKLSKLWATCAILLAAALFGLAACSSQSNPASQPIQAPTPQANTAPTSPVLQVALASSDLSVGANRLAFGVIDSQSGPLRNANIQVTTFYLGGGGQEGPIETLNSTFRKWPTGAGGVYTIQPTFDRAGAWGLGVVIADPVGSQKSTSVSIQVKEESSTPAIGSPAPRSDSKTSRDVEHLEELTTDPESDPELYDMTIAEALDTGKPLIVVFSSPAYCETATCGPQLNVIKNLKQQYEDRANFIHIEVYDNPTEIQGDLSRGRVSPTLTEWGLPSEPWTFIVDEKGLVYDKFEGFATSEQLEEALSGVL